VIRDLIRDMTIGEIAFALLAAGVVVVSVWLFCVTYVVSFS
jgi:hypothetical protein